MTRRKMAIAFLTYLLIFNIVIAGIYFGAFIAFILSIATGELYLTNFTIWSMISAYLLNKYVDLLIISNEKRIDYLMSEFPQYVELKNKIRER